MKKYLFNEQVIIDLLKDNKVVIVDGGARGELFPPFKYVNRAVIKVLRFEPDSDATISDTKDQDLVFNKALWNKKGQISINIAIEPSTSSVYPFNRELQQYIDPHMSIRKTKEVVTVDAISLDELVAENPSLKIDFIKLDVHGAEYETLEGGIEVLKSTLGLLIESWILPIHKGQKVRAHVEMLAYENGFYVFEEYQRASWARLQNEFRKRQTVAIDTLFFKDPMLDKKELSKIDAIKLICMANLFDHNAYALQLATHFHEQKKLDKSLFDMISNHIKQANTLSLLEKISMKFQRLIGRTADSAFK